jgi:hypothetical protein
MIEAVIMTLIYICVIALVVYLAFWVLEQIGVPLPPQVVKIIWIVVVLICLLLVVRVLLPPLHLGEMPLTLFA